MSVPADHDAPALAETVSSARSAGRRAGLGLVTGFALLALVDAGAIAVAVPLPQEGLALRAAHHLFDAAETLGLGVVAGALVYAFRSRVRLPAWGYALVYAAVTAPMLYSTLGGQLYRQAAVAFDGRFHMALYAVYVFFTSFAVTAAHLVGAFLSRFRRVRLVAAAVAFGGMIGDHLPLRDDYFGPHAAMAWIAATLAGAALAPLVERVVRGLRRRMRYRAALLALVGFGIFGVVVPPSNRVRYQLFRQPCAVAPWVLATLVWPAPRLHAPLETPSSPWLSDRAWLPPTPPTPARLLPSSAVVVMITVDALRADAVYDPRNDALFPNLTEMKRQGVYFLNNAAAGSQTAVTLTSTFTSRYFSELYWTEHGVGPTRFIYAADDPALRFPALLGQAGIPSASYCSVNFLASEFGVVRGFTQERVIPVGRRHALARQMIDPLLDRVRQAGDGPLFVYTHLMEPHSPYDRGRKDGTPWERYLSEIAVADAHIGRVWRLLEQRFRGRSLLIVSGDHGEAFDEHMTNEHSKTLYEEMVHVPLLVRGAGVVPRPIPERVGLIDLAPTVLDLFGLASPATFEGQSLVPLLAGSPAALERPVFSEGRLRRAYYAPDGLKVIEDRRRKLVEVYDLTRDPRELHDLFDEEPARSDRALATLRAFFASRELRRPGYRAPYKP